MSNFNFTNSKLQLQRLQRRNPSTREYVELEGVLLSYY